MVTGEVFFVDRFSSNRRFFQQNRRISRIVLRAYATRKLELLRRRRRNRENQNVIGLISKTKTLKVQHTFWFISLPPSQ